MRTSLNISNTLTKIDEMKGGDAVFQVLEYDELKGGKDVNTALMLSFMKDAHIKLRQLRIMLDNGSVRIETGALHFLKGNIVMENKMGGVLGIGKKMFASKVTGETTFKPVYKGTGELFLEPSFGHYALIELEDEEIVVDDGLFYACEQGIEVGAAMQKNLSSSLFGNEGLFQTKLSGSGVAALELPVPESEIIKVKLFNDTLKVDGDFAILRSGRLEFTVEKSSKSLLATATGGEGLLNVYKGTGEVWLMPTSSVYRQLGMSGIQNIATSTNKRNTDE